jgi:hypothetical protein
LRLLHNKRGQVHVIEAFFASMLVLSCLAFIPLQQTTEKPVADLTSKAQNVLLSLDGDGHLARLIDNRNWDGLRGCIESSLPLTMWFNLTVYDTNMAMLNEFPICNGGAVSSQISSVTYVCASPNSTFAVYVLQLQLAAVN